MATVLKERHKNTTAKEIVINSEDKDPQRKEGFKQEFSNLTKPHYKRT